MIKEFYSKTKILDKYLDIFLKGIPIGIAIFFIGSILFNISYFWNLDVKWTSLLVLSDYYEGTMEVILYFVIIGFIFLGLKHLYKIISKSFKMFKSLLSTILRLIRSYFKIIYTTIRFIRICVKLRNSNEISFSIKKELLYCKHSLPNIQKELIINTLQVIFLSIPIILFSLIGIMGILCLLVDFIYKIYLYNWTLFLLLILFYLYLKSYNDNKLNELQNIIFICLLYWLSMWSTGGLSAHPISGDNVSFLKFISRSQITYVSTNQEQDFILVRAINKGVIVKDEDNLYFFKWEDVKFLNKKNTK